MSVKGVLSAVAALVGFYLAVVAVAFPMLLAVVLIWVISLSRLFPGQRQRRLGLEG